MLGTCLLKFRVLNKMFSFVLMGSPEGTTPHFTLSILHPHQDEHSAYPVCLGSVGLLHPENGRAGEDPQASKLTAELKGVFPDPWLPLS